MKITYTLLDFQGNYVIKLDIQIANPIYSTEKQYYHRSRFS